MERKRDVITKFLLMLMIAVSASACGDLSNTVQLTFPTPAGNAISSSRSDSGLLTTGGTKTQGLFKLNGGIGNQVTDGVRVQGRFKMYGGIQTQGFVK
jgi:hypothetical protein